MLDDMLKLFLDPYYKPKKIDDPNRENLFELIYSPGNTFYSKEKINQRREMTWDNLYLTDEETKVFLNERFSTNKVKLSKIRAHRTSNKTPKDNKRSATVREESYNPKPIDNEQSHLQSAYAFSGIIPQARMNKFSNPKEVIENIFGAKLSKTETKFPKIRNPSDDRMRPKFIQKHLSNQNERSKTLLKKSKKVSKLPNDDIKVEEQFNFMTKFNLDVRERNKAKVLKDSINGIGSSKNSQTKTIENIKEEQESIKTPRVNHVNTPRSIRAKEVQNEYYDNSNKKNDKMRKAYPAKEKIENLSIASILTHNIESSNDIHVNKFANMHNNTNVNNDKLINDGKQDTIVLPNIKKKSKHKEIKQSSSKTSIGYERDIKRPHESTYISANENLEEENGEGSLTQRRLAKNEIEAKKKKKIKELK